MKKEDIKKFTELFDEIRKEADGETEFWYARDDDQGFARIRAKGDTTLFGGFTLIK